jgi:hypothetical protein
MTLLAYLHDHVHEKLIHCLILFEVLSLSCLFYIQCFLVILHESILTFHIDGIDYGHTLSLMPNLLPMYCAIVSSLLWLICLLSCFHICSRTSSMFGGRSRNCRVMEAPWAVPSPSRVSLLPPTSPCMSSNWFSPAFTYCDCYWKHTVNILLLRSTSLKFRFGFVIYYCWQLL